jgi:hypothetical protein
MAAVLFAGTLERAGIVLAAIAGIIVFLGLIFWFEDHAGDIFELVLKFAMWGIPISVVALIIAFIIG